MNKNILIKTLSALSLFSAISTTVMASPTQESSYTYPWCNGTTQIPNGDGTYKTIQNMSSCGALIVADGGAFSLDSTNVTPKDPEDTDTQNLGATQCKQVNKKIKKALDEGQYNLYVLPATCSYKVEAKIAGGNHKEQGLALTPGCQLTLEVKGDLVSNKTTTSASWTKQAKNNGASGSVVDSQGHKCGKLGKSGIS